jgi:hypothetical protein
MNDNHNDGLLADRFSINTNLANQPPSKQEKQQFRNVMGLDKPVPFDQAECDAKIKAVVKNAAERNTAARKERETEQGINTPQAIENRLKREHYQLKQDAKNAAIRLNEYGVPDVRHWQEQIDRLLKARKAAGFAGELGEERSIEKQLVTAEAELVQAQARLKKYHHENTRAVGLLKSWAAENLPKKSD